MDGDGACCLMRNSDAVSFYAKLIGDGESEHTIFEIAEKFFLWLDELRNASFFYQRVSPINVFFNLWKIDLNSSEFLNCRYQRIFFYNPLNLGISKNLSYKTILAIKAKKKFSNRTRCKSLSYKESLKELSSYHMGSSFVKGKSKKSKNSLLLSALCSIIGDSRGEEVFEIMTENTISIEKDILDPGNARQTFFISRVFSSSGMFLLYSENFLLSYAPKMSMNSVSLLSSIPDDLIFYFFVSNHISTFPKGVAKDVVLKYAKVFGKNLIGFCDYSKLTSFIQSLNNPDIKISEVCYILLLIGSSRNRRFIYTKKNNDNLKKSKIKLNIKNETKCKSLDLNALLTNHRKYRNSNAKYRKYKRSESNTNPHFIPDPGANHILISYLKKNDMKLKTTALVSLAIYNLNSQNKIILKILIEQIKKNGPFIYENRCLGYYDRSYRALAAISAALVSNPDQFISFNDSFSELLYNGLSFIGTNLYGNMFKRDSYARLPEIFYSELFFLLNTFSLNVNQVIQIFDNKIHANSLSDIIRLAATIFYLSFKILKDKIFFSKEIENWFFTSLEKIEELAYRNNKYQILLDFTLISLSILLNSTFNLKILTIIRRQILRTKEPRNVLKSDQFSISDKKMVTVCIPGFESMHYYKLCMGIVCCGFGTTKLNIKNQIDYKILIISFLYMDDNLTVYKHYDLFKLLLYNCTIPNYKFVKALNTKIKKLKIKKYKNKITKKFFSEFDRLTSLDKKIAIDILSDFIENYATKNDRKKFSIRKLARILTATK